MFTPIQRMIGGKIVGNMRMQPNISRYFKQLHDITGGWAVRLTSS